ncbi:MAG TPA: hypothetical protein VJT73_12275 [Polyangiaceae bacterium]|nr:hypothetical protein [Polyangiaceae bacterium]
MNKCRFVSVSSLLAGLFVATASLAAQSSVSVPSKVSTLSTGTSSVSSSSATTVAIAEPPPPAPPPTLSTPNEIAEQSGIGSGRTYARAGVLELGGFANFTSASDFTSIQVSPTAGYFVLDNIELSLILGFNYVHQTFNSGQPNEQSDHKTIFRLLLEPSYHLPLARAIWGFAGLGIGVASVPRPGGGASTGVDFAPRAGANFLIGRSGLLSPAFFIDYTTGEAVAAGGSSILGVNTSYGIQVGYTVMW